MTVTDMAIPRQLRARLRKTRRRLGFNRRSRRSVRIEEASGVRVSISSDLPHAAETGRHRVSTGGLVGMTMS